jgi:hypothetical protein
VKPQRAGKRLIFFGEISHTWVMVVGAFRLKGFEIKKKIGCFASTKNRNSAD